MDPSEGGERFLDTEGASMITTVFRAAGPFRSAPCEEDNHDDHDDHDPNDSYSTDTGSKHVPPFPRTGI
jgi:hypothetical protein